MRPFGEDIDGQTKTLQKYCSEGEEQCRGGRKRKRKGISSGLLLWPMFHHIQYFISGFGKYREAHQTTLQMTQHRENAPNSKTQNKKNNVSIDLNFKLTQWNI